MEQWVAVRAVAVAELLEAPALTLVAVRPTGQAAAAAETTMGTPALAVPACTRAMAAQERTIARRQPRVLPPAAAAVDQRPVHPARVLAGSFGSL